MAKTAPRNADLRQLLEKELAEGYRVRANKSGHFTIIGPDGKAVRRDNNVAVTVANTPGDPRTMKNLRATLKRHGIHRSTNGAGPKRAQREHVSRPDLKGLSREEQAAAAVERQRKSRELRSAMEPWIKKLGGWEARGLKADIAAILHDLNERILPANAAVMLTGFTRGDGVGDLYLDALSSLHDMFQTVEEPRGLYADLARKARGLTTSLPPVVLKPGQEWPYEVRLLKLADMFADISYQRPEHEPFVRQLVLTFDERLVGVIDVSRREDGRYAILDGQQRTATMRQVGKTKAYCAIYEGLSVGEEAQFFFHKNKDRKGMSAFYGFRARTLAGDPKAIAIDTILADHGYAAGPATDSNLQIGAIRAVEDVYEFETDVRENCLPPTLQTMKACFLGRKSSLDAEIIRGLGRFYRTYADSEIAFDHWHEALTALGPLLVLGRARDFGGATEQRGHGRSMAATLVEIHNTGLPSAERLSLARLAKA